MTLSINEKKDAGEGIVVQQVSIASIEDISNSTPPFLSMPCDLGVKMSLDIGRDFQPDFMITGALKRDTEGIIIGWGGAFKIRDFFANLGISGDLVPDDIERPTTYSIPQALMDAAKGQQFLRLSYVCGKKPNGKTRWADWTDIGSIAEGETVLIQRFKKSVAKGYPSNFKPESEPINETGPESPF